ncbi:plastidial pyruvate kinase 2-like [Pistacia vera]|nr:plastidial pyruvate kinase 2-like [Pistacia vera]
MAQVVATRLIQSSFLCPSSGSMQERAEKLKPQSFASKVLAREEKRKLNFVLKSTQISAKRSTHTDSQVIPVSPEDVPKKEEHFQHFDGLQQLGDTSVGMWTKPTVRRKTKIVCTIGPSTNTREMIWKLAEAGMNVARMNMSHGDHASHQRVIDLVKEYNAQSKDNVISIMLDTKGPEVRSGDLPQPINLTTGQEFTFTIRRGVGTADCVSVNYDDFVNDVEVGDMLLVDG